MKGVSLSAIGALNTVLCMTIYVSLKLKSNCYSKKNELSIDDVLIWIAMSKEQMNISV